MAGWMDAWLVGWMDGCMAGWMAGWMKLAIQISIKHTHLRFKINCWERYELQVIFLPLCYLSRMGAHLKIDEVGTEQDFRVERIIMHPYYKRPFGLAHDIALLKLDRPAQITKHVGLVCLPEDYNPLPIDNENKKCWITGICSMTYSYRLEEEEIV